MKKFFLLESVLLIFLLQKVEATSEGWRQEGNYWYYYNDSNEKVTNHWIGSYYVGADGVWIEGYGEIDGEWIEIKSEWINQKKWKFRKQDGTYVKGWQLIEGKWYFFDENGYQVTGSYISPESEAVYYFHEDGTMARDEVVDGRLYYMGEMGQKVI